MNANLFTVFFMLFSRSKVHSPWNFSCANRRTRRHHGRTLSHDCSMFHTNQEEANIRHEDLRRLESDHAAFINRVKTNLLASSEVSIPSKKRQCSTSKSSEYMEIIFLNTIEGYWELDAALSELLVLPLEEIVQKCPFQVCEQQRRRSPFSMPSLANAVEASTKMDRENKASQEELLGCVWATAISLLYLHHKFPEFAAEWQLIHRKAYNWLINQKLPEGWTIEDIIRGAERRFFSPF